MAPLPQKYFLYTSIVLVLALQMRYVAPTLETVTIPPPHEGEFPTATLRNGDVIPLVGLGGCSGVRKAHVLSALESGYRYFDTAQAYVWGYKEEDVGAAIQSKSGDISRDEVYVQSKIHPQDLGYGATKEAVSLSLHRLGLSHLDSMLIHKPRCWGGICQKVPEGTWQDSWIALEEMYDASTVKAIGICDVGDSLLNELLQQRIKPHVIQNWMDPFHQDKHIRKRCKEEGIQYQAYSTLGNQWGHQGYDENPVLTNPTLITIADKYGVDVAQVIINWATRHGISVIPASTNSSRQKSNLNSFGFDLTDEEMLEIDSLDGKVPEAPRPDPDEVSVVFKNQGDSKLDSFWIGHSKEEVHVGEIIAYGAVSLNSYHGHIFVFRDEDGKIVGEHTIDRNDGSNQQHVFGVESEL